MKETLLKFKNLEIDKTQLKQGIGDDLYNVDCSKPIIVNKEDVSKVIQKYLEKKISLEKLSLISIVTSFLILKELSGVL